MPKKQILYIILFILISIGIGFGIYFLFFKPLIPQAPTPPKEEKAALPTAGLPSAPLRPEIIQPELPARPEVQKASEFALGGITKTFNLVSKNTLNPILSSDGQTLLFYDKDAGQFFRISPDGRLDLLTDKIFYNVSKVNWAPDTQKAILEYPDGSKILYNFETKTSVTLPKHWEQFSFSPDSQQIAFLSIGYDENNRWLAIANADGSKTKALYPLGMNASKVQVNWSPNNQVIAFSKTGEPSGPDSQEILLIGKNKENFKSLIVNGLNFEGQWSPNGEKILYSVASSDNDWKPRLWVVKGTPDAIGENKTLLELETWADKCRFANEKTIYCAVPKELPKGAGFYPPIADTIADDIYKIDLDTGRSTLISVPEENHTIDKIFVSQDEKILYFSDKNNGQIYKINLSQ